ncbi:MAG: hypothetical protein K2K56_02415 [Lachnospiraceae bacterium]|nr:hypothetical protein [Lachnospiraceae bacterium]
MKNRKKILTGIMAVFLVCLLVTGCGEKAEDADTVDMQKEQVKVTVTDGVAEPGSTIQNLKVSEDGKYTLRVNYKPDREGLITGFILYDKDRSIVRAFTAEWIEISSEALELKEGTYTLELRYLTNQKDKEDFERLYVEGDYEYVEYDFLDNGVWNMELEYGLVKDSGPGMYYYLGMVCGVVFTILFLVIMSWLIRKTGGKVSWGYRKDSYDERQQLARGEAYKYAFFTLMFYMTVVSVISEFYGMPLFMSFCGIWIGVCLSITVFAVICILKDAYMSLYENAKGVMMLFSVVALMNIGVAVRIICEGRPMLEDGAFSVDCVNLVVGIMFCVILAVFCGKVVYNRKSSEEEEGE